MGVSEKLDELKNDIQHFIDEYNMVKAENQKLKEQTTWVSVKDKLPDDHEGILVWFEYFKYGDYNDYNHLFQRYAIGNYVDKTWYINGETAWLQQIQVIAWMPLPNPPKE